MATLQRYPVLIAEEHDGFLNVYAPALKEAGYNIQFVRRGSEALKWLVKSQEPMVALINFDLVFDLILDEMTWRPECSSNVEYRDHYLLTRSELMEAPTVPPIYAAWLASRRKMLRALAERHAITLTLADANDLPDELESARKQLPPAYPISVFRLLREKRLDSLLERVTVANARLNARRVCSSHSSHSKAA